MCSATPCWSDWLLTEWGFPDDVIYGSGFAASNVVVGSNPPYAISDFVAFYPKFGQSPPPVPNVVLQAYITLASASLVQARWLEQWPIAMALFVAHFATLYAKSDGNPLSTVGQIAAQGISTGIQVGKSVGDVSVNYQPVTGLEDWGSWNLTSYGQQLATMAKIVGAGPMLLV